MLNKYRLTNGKIYWHKLWFSIAPRWMTKYAPPFSCYNYAALVYQPHTYFIGLYDEARWFIQRGRRGYSDRDIWGLDQYLASWMPEALEQLRRAKHGTPIGMTPKGWDTRISKMIDGFKTARKQIEDVTKVEGWKTMEKRRLEGFRLFSRHFFDLWD